MSFLLLAAAAVVATAPATQLNALFDEAWEFGMKEDPVWASQLGDRRYNTRWPEATVADAQRRTAAYRDWLKRLQAIPRASLPAADQVNYDLFQRGTATDLEQLETRWYLVPMSHMGGPQNDADLTETLRFDTVQDYDDWCARLEAYPAYVDQRAQLMREGLKAGLLLPRVIMARVPAQLAKQIVKRPEASDFYKPFKTFPAAIPGSERARLKARAARAIATGIVPAYQRFAAFYNKTYLPACYPEVGLWRVPGGNQIYDADVRRHTTTTRSAEQIHQTGLAEVARIRKEMEAIKVKTGFKGTLGSFFAYLRTAPQFHHKDAASLLAAYRALAKTVDPKLVKVFKTLPRIPYGVEPIPSGIAPYSTTAYYQAPAKDGSRGGTFYVNLYKPEVRPTWEMPALTMHESVPGHHLQIALAFEQPTLPAFRRYGGSYTAFVEGWGLYAESLGDDMGMYADPYAKFGQLTYEMWRAVRLVVDTGMHRFHWSRDKAVAYFLANTPRQRHDVENEIDRYIADPGQALAYKVGQLKIKELREEARRTLGTRFDLREFHDVVLRDGAVPLDMLEVNVKAWAGSQAHQGPSDRQLPR